MIWILLQSESPWQRNNAITFFYLFFSFTVRGVFLRNRLRQYVPAIIASNSRLPIPDSRLFSLHHHQVEGKPWKCGGSGGGGGGKTIEMWWQW